MTREEAIKIIKECKEKGFKHTFYTVNEYYTALDMAIKALEQEARWIPVSERLPEDEYVLISKIPTKISGSKWSVAIAIRTADPRSRKIQWRDSGFGVIQDDKVLAWMPLPKPYQEGKQDG